MSDKSGTITPYQHISAEIERSDQPLINFCLWIENIGALGQNWLDAAAQIAIAQGCKVKHCTLRCDDGRVDIMLHFLANDDNKNHSEVT